MKCELCSEPPTNHYTEINTVCPDCSRTSRGQGTAYFGPACPTNCVRLGKFQLHYCAAHAPGSTPPPPTLPLVVPARAVVHRARGLGVVCGAMPGVNAPTYQTRVLSRVTCAECLEEINAAIDGDPI